MLKESTPGITRFNSLSDSDPTALNDPGGMSQCRGSCYTLRKRFSGAEPRRVRHLRDRIQQFGYRSGASSRQSQSQFRIAIIDQNLECSSAGKPEQAHDIHAMKTAHFREADTLPRTMLR
ncbi:MAG: hypothetical protein JWO80_5518 [Bryobacterales bacterium]|nr:hypothetical protein [Bryobacterales bacterium]